MALRILVTGVTTAVGRAVARQLLASGHTVIGIAPDPHDNLDPDVDFVCAPLGGSLLQQLADEAHVVLHLAPIEPAAPGSAGINGLVHVAHAAARSGARLVFPSQAAGQPELYQQAETLVSTGWAPSLIVRMAPLVGRPLDWAVCRTVTSLMRSSDWLHPVRLLHIDDLIRFLVLAVTANTTGAVDLGTPDTTNVVVARHLLRTVAQTTRASRPATWAQLTPHMDMSALREDWVFDFGWSAADAIADTARGLIGRKLDAGGALEVPGHLPLPHEVKVRSRSPDDGATLLCAAPDGLEGEFDDRIDPRFPVFSAATLADVLPGPLTPLSLDVQLSGLRSANRVIGQVIALGDVVAAEWGNRAIAVFGHRPYVGVSAIAIAASQLPGWDERAVVDRLLRNAPVDELLPLGRPPLAGGVLGSAAKALVMTRALAVLRHLKTQTQAYRAAATAEHLDAAALTGLPEASLQVRARLLRDRIHQGWGLTALWLIDTGVTAATLERAGSPAPVTGIDAMLKSGRVAAETAALAAALQHDASACALAHDGNLDGIRAQSPRVADGVDAALKRMAHRGPGEAELANPTFGDDPSMLLTAAAQMATTLNSDETPADASAPKPAERIATTALVSGEMAHDTTMRFTHELRTTLRELGTRWVAADIIDVVDDVYYLTCDEVLTTPGDARLRVKRRRAERDRLQALRLPEVIDHRWQPLDTN